jgi:DNA-binding NtrC family response regulator
LEENVATPTSKGGLSRMAIATVLVVDDDPDVLKMTCIYLRLHNYDIFSASDPRKALEIVNANHDIDLVISDVDMPQMRGTELVREIIQISPGTACMLVSGLEIDPESVPNGIPLLQKPINATDLFSTINNILHSKGVAASPA